MDIDFSTGIYRCNDISTFQIKISLKTIKSSLTGLAGLYEDIQDAELEEVIFTWQQRVFSPWEIKLYRNIENCTSELHRTYNKKVLEIDTDKNYNRNVIFSYTSDDFASYSKNYKSDSFRYLSEPTKRNPLNVYKDFHSIVVPIVDYNPGLQTKINNQQAEQEFMFIMADVGYLTDGKVNEQILVTLKWEPSLRVLIVFPDFNSTSGPGYTIEGLYDVRNHYLFWLTYPKPKKSLQFIKQGKEHCKVSPIDDLVLPQYGLLDVYLFAEIKSAENFEQDNLFVNYNFELKEGWNFISGDLFGVTYNSRNISGFCCFNHLFELHFTTSSHNNISLDLFPQLLLEVVSFDNWGRVCREGCGWIRIVPIPGQHVYKIPTWRSDTHGNSRINLMKRFFTGATSHTADRSFYGVPNSFTGKHLSKFGFGTISSGCVNIDINIALQSQSLYRLPSKNNFEERLSTGSLMQSINSAFNKFSSARQRLHNVSESVSST